MFPRSIYRRRRVRHKIQPATFEIRKYKDGEFLHLLNLWKSTMRRSDRMKKLLKPVRRFLPKRSPGWLVRVKTSRVFSKNKAGTRPIAITNRENNSPNR